MSETTNQTAQERLSAIKKLGNTATAITQIKELLVDYPDFIPGWLELGLVYRRFGDRASALKTFTEALKLQPEHRNLRFELSTEQLHLNQLVECRQNTQELQKLYPKDSWILIRLGEIERKENNHNQALAIFQQAIQLRPQTIWAHINTAIELKYFQRFTEAEQQLQTALQYHPNHFNVLIYLGELQETKKQPEEALKYFQQAEDNHLQRIEPGLKKAELLRDYGRFAEAEKQLKQMLNNFPDNFRVLINFGHLERRREQKEQALKYFELASQKATDSFQAMNAQLFVVEELRGLGKIDEAIVVIKPILEEYPNNIRAKIIYCSLLKMQLNFTAATEVCQEVIKLDHHNIYGHLEFATCLAELGKIQEAIDVLENIQNRYYHDLRVFHKFGYLYRKQQNRQQALKYYQKCLEIDPQHLWANLDTATELKEIGDLEAAERQIHQALKYHPHNYHALIQLGLLEQRRQQLDVALKHFQTVKEKYPEKIEPHFHTIEILGYLGRFEEAKNNIASLQTKYPEDSRVFIRAGHLERLLGHRENALHCYNLAKEKSTNSSQKLEAQIFSAEELRELGRWNEAMKLIEETIEQFPENLRLQIIKGSILQKQPNLIAATNLYKNILATEPKHLQSRLELARVYSQSGQVETAINLLKETDKLLGANIHVLIQLGSLYQSLNDWQTARQWYQKACQEYPYNPHVYCSLANLFFLEGETELAIQLLEKAQTKISKSPPIIIKLADLQMRLGNLESSYNILVEGLKIFPGNVPILWQLCHLYMAKGYYQAALEVLDKISTDNQEWIRQTENIKANIYFYQYDYQKAESHFQKAIYLTPIATQERNRLAIILMLTGRIQEARQQLQIATKELHLKTSPGTTAVPLKSHPAMITNELLMNPDLMKKLQAAQQEIGQERLLKLGSLITEEPTYLGSTLYLTRELREQGVFDAIQQELSQNNTNIIPIPKRIVQFWDEPEPPQEVQKICQSWSDLNQGYEYTLFNWKTALAFLQKYYDEKVMKAFANCDQPATQADFFRLAYLNKMGGFYADADDLCRQPLDLLVNLRPELVILQEDFACIGNNFIGCIPGQNMIRTAFYQAVNNLREYCNESPWFKTGPGLLTSVVASGLVPYLTYTDYQMWPRLLVLSQSQLRKIVNQHLSLAYKRTNKSWQQKAYQRRIKLKPIT